MNDEFSDESLRQLPPIPPIPDVVSAYLERLVLAFPAITAIWLFGSRANGTFRPDSDWDFLVFADRLTLDALRAGTTYHWPEVDIFIVYDGIRFENPWPEDGSKRGCLCNARSPHTGTYVESYCWLQRSTEPNYATYKSTRDPNHGRLNAYRIHPRSNRSASEQ